MELMSGIYRYRRRGKQGQDGVGGGVLMCGGGVGKDYCVGKGVGEV